LAFTSSGRTVTNPLRAIRDEVVGTYSGSANKYKKAEEEV
jgi:hypothetical protein